ncbi:MAG: aspartate carbamoyltransferase regulatory subunit [Deltaproteobacteria bacterium]|nr:aspartate carbamoyltransferase regulatory subunit [Deltaproteobacteria bacterium]
MGEKYSDRPYKVYKIQRGTAIDHIPSHMALKVLEILGIAEGGGIVTIGINFDSKTLGKKGVVKIENRILEPRETDLIALVAPTATINIIENGKVVEKRPMNVPEDIRGLLRCPNPNCVTNMDPEVEPRFHLVGRNQDRNSAEIKLCCHYCERVYLNSPEMFT